MTKYKTLYALLMGKINVYSFGHIHTSYLPKDNLVPGRPVNTLIDTGRNQGGGPEFLLWENPEQISMV